MVLRVVNSWWVMSGAFLAVALWWFLSIFPTSTYWYEAHSMSVPDVEYGEELVLDVDREIHRPVQGSWNVVVRKLRDGGWTHYCVARGVSNYTPGAQLPDPLTLDWWVEDKCPELTPGTYTITTTWVFEPVFTPTNRASPPLVSNPFRVLEQE